MNIDIKSREQKQFEESAKMLIAIFSELSPQARKEVINYTIYKYNDEREV